MIPGAGHHSKAGAVIKPKVIEELTRQNLTFHDKNVGTLLVTIEGKKVETESEGTTIIVVVLCYVILCYVMLQCLIVYYVGNCVSVCVYV